MTGRDLHFSDDARPEDERDDHPGRHPRGGRGRRLFDYGDLRLLILAMIVSVMKPARADSLRVELTGINYKTSMLFNLAGLGVIIILVALYGYLWDVP